MSNVKHGRACLLRKVVAGKWSNVFDVSFSWLCASVNVVVDADVGRANGFVLGR